MLTVEQVAYGAEECAKQGHYPNACKCWGEAMQHRAEKAEARVVELESHITGVEALEKINENGYELRISELEVLLRAARRGWREAAFAIGSCCPQCGWEQDNCDCSDDARIAPSVSEVKEKKE